MIQMTTNPELAAILHKTAFAPLNTRAFLRITGPDATRWLNGMVTNSVQALTPGEGNYNFLLNAQGRILGDCTIYREPEPDQPPSFLLASDTAQIDGIQQHLDRFIIMDDVELTPLALSGLSLVGPEAFPTLSRAMLASEELAAAAVPSAAGMYRSRLLGKDAITLIPPPPIHQTCQLWFTTQAQVKHLEEQLRESGVAQVSPEALEQLRILEARPLYGIDITEKYLPQETSQAHALHFAKGCYLGQEIVERIRSRGQVHRLFTPFRLEGTVPTLPAPLESNGKPVGELTSATSVSSDDGATVLALGYIRREALESHAPLTYPGGTAHPRKPGQSI